ncbi:hypothetical protein BOTBODRAFT_43748 [Botryobasidium botryosum FD-172 SS1]|uniref:Uncharacterized protein n=1 Tax=Botryobasidium botryosum (strain FD-172 SS1) TaxID=930990 RepID=A0A067MJR3_BOTB1|nr:hypothetical protein BOTBODRAFT_43748 [Botryobasidium botryosum FD-172 SS1]
MAYIQKESAPVVSYPYSPTAHAPPSLMAYTNELHDYTMQLWIQARRQADRRAAELHRSTSPVSSRDSHDQYHDTEHDERDEHGTPRAPHGRDRDRDHSRQRNGRNGSIVRTAKEWMESLTSKNAHGNGRPKSSHSH